MDKVKKFIKDHFILLLTIVIFLVLWCIGTIIRSSARKDYNAVYSQLSDVRNEIDHDNLTLIQQKNYETIGVVGGLDKTRWQEDDVAITEWIYPAFNFSDATEYNKNREIYVEKLGGMNDFVTEIMPPYNPAYAKTHSEDESIDDGTDINMHMINFVSYVDSINDDVYSYIAVVDTESLNKKGNTAHGQIIMTYSINGKGEVRDFHAAATYNPA